MMCGHIIATIGKKDRIEMKKSDIVRAWKDSAFYDSLSAEERALVPPNPAGVVELSDDELEGVTGSGISIGSTSCCKYYSVPPADQQ